MVIVEHWMSTVLKKLIPVSKGGFVDVGVNLGQTLITVDSIDPSIEYIGFEPNPACINYLNILKEVNGLGHYRVCPVGVSLKTTVAELFLFEDNFVNSGGSTIENYWEYNNIKAKRSLMVPLLSLSDLPFPITCGILKIDVEGAELDVLKSFKEIIIQQKPLIICEVLSAYEEANKLRYDAQLETEDLIAEIDYQMLVVRLDGKEEVRAVEKVENFAQNMREKDDCNYLFVHKSEIDRILNLFSH